MAKNDTFDLTYWERFQELLSVYQDERRDRSPDGHSADRYGHCEGRCSHDLGRGLLTKEATG